MSKSIRNAWTKAIKNNAVYEKLCEEVLSDPVQYNYRFCRVVESTEVQSIKAGSWFLVNKEKVVFISSKDESVSYRIPVHRVKNNEVDVFSLEWQLKTCSFSEIEYLSEPDDISKKLAQLV